MHNGNPRVEDLVQATALKLGSYGPLLQKIRILLESPQCSLGKIADIIEKDPDLTARLLRFANSAFFGLSMRISTVTEAISLIGVEHVQNLLTVSNVIEQFAEISEEFVSMRSFWEHSLACGIASRLIALEGRLPKPDRFFVAGLLHDIGRLVLFVQLPHVQNKCFIFVKEKCFCTKLNISLLATTIRS